MLMGGEPEMATIELEDCVDTDIQEVITLLEGNDVLQETAKSKIHAVCIPWDLPRVTEENRRWLKEKILMHAVLGRIARQVSQLKKGLKDTGVWELLSSRPDAVSIFFPRDAQVIMTSQMVLEKIVWPTEGGSSVERSRQINFLNHFIQTRSSVELKSLLCFWTGSQFVVVPSFLKEMQMSLDVW
uniref:Uncharacterized protein n=1 Tax=Knipowitschia caucasica TaxID=637954 RepID=A0AAV2JUR1_KNICA